MENVSAAAADTLLNTITTPPAPPAAPVTEPAGASAPPSQDQPAPPPSAPIVTAPAFTSEDVNRFLSKEIGEGYDLDRVKELAKAPAPKQYHPLAEKVNHLLSEGKIAEIDSFLKIQTLDVTALAPYEAIQKEISLKYPSLSASEIDAYLKREGLDPADETSSGLIKIRGEQAKEYLQQQKVNTDFTPTAPVSQAQSAEQQAYDLVLQQRWPSIAEKIATTTTEHDLIVELEGGVGYSYKHTFSPETIKAATEQAAQLAIGQKWGFTPENAGQIKDLVLNLAKMAEYEKIMQGVVKDAYASARQDAMKSVAGAPVGSPKLNTMTETPKAPAPVQYIK